MRIPVYEQQRGVSAPQVRTTQVAPPLDLGQTIDIIENKYEQGVKAQEQGRKLFAANEMSRVDLELSQKYAEIQDRIANGGEYAGADKEFSEYFDQVTNESVQRLGPTDIIGAGAQSDYQKFGIEYGLRLKNSIRSRAKADAVSNYNAKVDMLSIDMSNAATEAERIKIMGDFNSELSKATSMGVFNKDEAAVKLRSFANNSVNTLIDNDPSAFVEDYKANPKKYAGIESIEQKVKYAKEKAIQFETASLAAHQYDIYTRNVDQLQRARQGKLTAADYEDTESPVIKAIKSKSSSAKMSASDNANALVEYDKGLDGLSSMMAGDSDPRDVIKALDKFQNQVLSSVGSTLTASQAASIVKQSQNLFFSKTSTGSIKEYDPSFDVGGGSIMPGIQAPTKHAAEYLADNIPSGLTGADKVRYKINFIDAFDDALGDYQSTGKFKKDKEIVTKAINTAQEAVATQRNPSLFAVPGTPNRIVGGGKDEVVSGESTAESKRSVVVPTTTDDINNMNEAELKAYLGIQ